ncbi:hypothetical protein D3C80_1418320 [compost metagenome]
MGLQKLHHEAFGDQAFVIQVIHKGVMPEGRPAFVHDLGLPLWVEVLRDFAHDPYDFTLPRLQQGGVLFNEIQDVFLWFGGEARIIALAVLVRALGDGSPQVVDLLLQVLFAVLLPAPFLLGGNGVGALVAVDTVVHQGVAGVE